MVTEPTLNRPTFTVGEVVHRCGVSKSTVKRRLREGAFPNAYQDDPTNPQSPWRIPVEDLLAAGLNPGKPGPPDPQTPVTELTAESATEPTVTLRLSEYRELVEAASQAEVLRELAWAWKTAHDTAQRQLPPSTSSSTGNDAMAVVDVRDQKRRRLFRKKSSARA
jgi:hypothetical protein